MPVSVNGAAFGFRPTAAFLVLLAAPAGTGVVPANFGALTLVGLGSTRSGGGRRCLSQPIRLKIPIRPRRTSQHALQELVGFLRRHRLIRPVRIDLPGDDRDGEDVPLAIVSKDPVPALRRKPRAAHIAPRPIAPGNAL